MSTPGTPQIPRRHPSVQNSLPRHLYSPSNTLPSLHPAYALMGLYPLQRRISSPTTVLPPLTRPRTIRHDPHPCTSSWQPSPPPTTTTTLHHHLRPPTPLSSRIPQSTPSHLPAFQPSHPPPTYGRPPFRSAEANSKQQQWPERTQSTSTPRALSTACRPNF